MILRSGYPFWLVKDGMPNNFPKLDRNQTTDVVIVGAGISGALMRYYLIEAGIDCITIDSRTIGLGSTCASTSLLQYEIDVPLYELIEKVGKKDAERAYVLCAEAIDELGKIARKLKFKDFEFKKSLYYAAYKKDVAMLHKEYQARKEAGFDVAFLDAGQIKKQFGFSAPAAILSQKAAQTNAYLMTHFLLQFKKALHPVFDRTRIVKREHHPKGIILHTEGNHSIKAKKIIYATGYEVTEMIEKKIVDLKSTYAVISEQQSVNKFWQGNALIWNTAQPYLYLRSTNDGRILVGGRDEDFYDPKKRDALIGKKSKQLAADFKKLMPQLDFNPEFSWTGTFGETKDGLPFIGKYSKMPDSYFALGFGGNGITFSVVAAQIITDLIVGRENKDARIFSFDRV